MKFKPKTVRVIRWVGVPDSKVSELIKDITDELAGKTFTIIITRGSVELWIGGYKRRK